MTQQAKGGEVVREVRKLGYRFIELRDDHDFLLAASASAVMKLIGVASAIVLVGLVVASVVVRQATTAPISGRLVPAEEVPVYSRLEGQVVRVLVKDGDPVAKGTEIARLDVRRYEEDRTSKRRERAGEEERLAESEREVAEERRASELEIVRLAGEIEERSAELGRKEAMYTTRLIAAEREVEAAEARLRAEEAKQPDERRQAEERVERARLAEDQAKREWEQIREHPHLVPRTEIEAAETAYRQAEAEQRAARGALALLETDQAARLEDGRREVDRRRREIDILGREKALGIGEVESAMRRAETGKKLAESQLEAQRSRHAIERDLRRKRIEQLEQELALLDERISEGAVRSPIGGRGVRVHR